MWTGAIYAACASHAFARAGQSSRAREILGDVVETLRGGTPFESYLALTLNLAAETTWELRDPDTAAVLLPWAQAVMEQAPGDHYLTCTELTVGRLCTVLDRFDEAAAAFALARTALERRGQRPLRAIVDHDEAVARTWRGQPGAAAPMAAAKAAFAEMGMAEWSRRAASQEAAAGEPELPDGLTPREAEILRLVAAGMSNRQIASARAERPHRRAPRAQRLSQDRRTQPRRGHRLRAADALLIAADRRARHDPASDALEVAQVVQMRGPPKVRGGVGSQSHRVVVGVEQLVRQGDQLVCGGDVRHGQERAPRVARTWARAACSACSPSRRHTARRIVSCSSTARLSRSAGSSDAAREVACTIAR